MLRSMYSAIGGLRGFQTKLDVIGNNIANVNTAGYKKSRTMFQDILSQTVSGAQAPGTEPRITGGVNPKQIGLGSTMASIDVVHTQGAPTVTNLPSDLMIQGNGFFVVSNNSDISANQKDYLLTRAGNFTMDANGQLVTSDGKFVLNGAGKKIDLFELTGGGGAVDKTQYKVESYSIADNGSVTAIFKDNTTGVEEKRWSIDTDNTEKIAVAYITNPGGLLKKGNSTYQWTPAADATGDATTMGDFNLLAGEAKMGGRGQILSGQLEMSNTDLSEEFTEMIVAQRGFQANSRIITTSDSILEELVNLKR